MREISGSFDKLYFSESVLGVVCLEGDRLAVPVSGLFVLAGHPLEEEGGGPYTGELIFDGVTDSRRTVTEYIGDSRNPDGFKSPREERVDISTHIHAANATQEYGFEGYQHEPSAWIDNWLVRAESFILRVA